MHWTRLLRDSQRQRGIKRVRHILTCVLCRYIERFCSRLNPGRLQKLQVVVAVVMIMWWRHFVDPGVIWMLQEVKNVVSCLMKFLRKTKTLLQQQQQQQQQQQAGKQAATIPTPHLSSATTPQSNAPPLPRTPLTTTATGIAPAASSAAAAPPPSSHAAASSSVESTENVIVMDVADLILAAEIGQCPTQH